MDSTHLFYSFVKHGPLSRRGLLNSLIYSSLEGMGRIYPQIAVLLLRLENEVCKIAEHDIWHTAGTQ